MPIKDREKRLAYQKEWRKTRKRPTTVAQRAAYAAYRRAHPKPSNKEKTWISSVKHLYGITAAQWHEMLIAQAGECAICGDQMTRPCVDHNHETGQIRELLCVTCNSAIGLLRDDEKILHSALKYLSKHEANHEPL